MDVQYLFIRCMPLAKFVQINSVYGRPSSLFEYIWLFLSLRNLFQVEWYPLNDLTYQTNKCGHLILHDF